MKKLIYVLFPWLLGFFGNHASAQETNDSKTDNQEIIIRKKGDKDATVTLQFKGDMLMINGKPLVEFDNSDGITINKKKIIIGKGMQSFNFNNDMDGMQGFGGNEFNTSQPFLGISMEKANEGVKITDVSKESAAEKAGLQKDDIVTAIDDTKTTSDQVLSEYIRSKKVGDKIKISYLRNGKKDKITAVLQENKNMKFNFSMPNTPGTPRVFTFPQMPNMPDMPDMENFNFNGMAPKGQRLGVSISDRETGSGVTVTNVEEDSPAEKSGLKKDDIITDINGKKVENTDDARNALRLIKDLSNYPVMVTRNGTSQTITVSIPKKLKTVNL